MSNTKIMMSMQNKIEEMAQFTVAMDQLKFVHRKTYLKHENVLRNENSAEHSWSLALACWMFADYLPRQFNVEKLIKMALIHDLGEIEAGDTFLYSQQRSNANIAERQCVQTLSNAPGNTLSHFLALWDEQEFGQSEEVKLLKVIDRMLPFFHNIQTQGRAWQENNVKKSQVANAHAFIRDSYPDLFEWFSHHLNNAVNLGWLIDE